LSQELVHADPVELAALTPAGMPRLFELAVQKGGVEALERLMALQERMLDRQASHDFAAALAAFQSACPPIKKTSTAKVITKGGSNYTYTYAELDEIARTVRPFLHQHGLSYTWDSELSQDAGMLTVTCTLEHAHGHKKTATFKAPTEAVSQAMSPQQRHASALTYGRRQTLIAVLGLTTCDPDTDAAPSMESTAPVTPAQVAILEALIDKRPDGSRALLLDYLGEKFGAKTLEELPAIHFAWLKGDLEKKIARDAK